MKHPVVPALVVALVHAAIVLSLGVKAAVDRERLPRAWTRVAASSQWNRLHGRYLTLNLTAVADAGLSPRLDVINDRTVTRPTPIALEARDGRLLAHKAAASRVDLVRAQPRADAETMIAQRVDCFLPPASPDPMPLLRKGELWVEVAVPTEGPPRPLRLGTIKDGRMVALTGEPLS